MLISVMLKIYTKAEYMCGVYTKDIAVSDIGRSVYEAQQTLYSAQLVLTDLRKSMPKSLLRFLRKS